MWRFYFNRGHYHILLKAPIVCQWLEEDCGHWPDFTWNNENIVWHICICLMCVLENKNTLDSDNVHWTDTIQHVLSQRRCSSCYCSQSSSVNSCIKSIQPSLKFTKSWSHKSSFCYCATLTQGTINCASLLAGLGGSGEFEREFV